MERLRFWSNWAAPPTDDRIKLPNHVLSKELNYRSRLAVRFSLDTTLGR